MRLFLHLLFFVLSLSCLGNLKWPTCSTHFKEGKSFETWVQPTASGIMTSGLFGDVRSNGWQFHEGLDIKSFKKDKYNNSLDEIYAALDGEVVEINKIGGNSSYGIFIVLEHKHLDVPVYSYYAHLSKIESNIAVGFKVKAGQKIGQMGRSASYTIPKSRAHLHFELGLKYSNNFDKWYTQSKRFGTKNRFGNYNGMNLVGFDPLDFYTKAKNGELLDGFKGYISSIPVAVVVRIYTVKTPSFVKMYPALVDNNGSDYGWDIHLSWFGLPIKFEKIKNPTPGAREGQVEVIGYNPDEIKRNCRRMINVNSKGEVSIRNELKDIINKIFP